MSPLFDTPEQASSPVDRLDPRGRVLVAAGFALVVALAQSWPALGAAVALAIAATVAAQIAPRRLARRLLPLNVFLILLVLLLPRSGAPLADFGPLGFSREGLVLAGQIALKGNAMVLLVMALLGRLDMVTLGHALNHIYVPDKLTHLLLFMVRYLELFRREYLRLREAMVVRGFRPRANRHTYRAYGYLVGMLLVRSIDRSERTLAAMKCRGFHGHFYLLDHFAFARRDVLFATLAGTALLGLALLEWA